MEKYEIMYILNANLDDETRKNEIEKLAKILKDNGANVKNTKEWGLKDFAYSIKKQTKGYYVILKVDAEQKGLAEFNRLVKLNNNVIRHLVTLDQE